MARKDILKITFDTNTKDFERNLISSMGAISDAASEKLTSAFLKAGKDPKLKKQLTGVYQGLFDDLTEASGDLDRINDAIDNFAGKIDYINKVARKSKIKGLFDNLSVENVDKALAGYDKVIEKEKKIAEYSSDKFRENIFEKTKIKSLKILENTYGDVEIAQSKYEKQLNDYVKSAGIESSIISKEIKQYSSLIALFEKINNTKVDIGTEDAIKKNQALFYVMKQINDLESGNTLFSNFRGNELKNIDKITSELSVLERGIKGSITKFIAEMTKPLKAEISSIYQEVVDAVLKMSKHQDIAARKTQVKVDTAIGKGSGTTGIGKNESPIPFEEKPDGIDVWIKSAEELEEEFRDVIKYATDAEKTLERIKDIWSRYNNGGKLFDGEIEEMFVLMKRLDSLEQNKVIEKSPLNKEQLEEFNDILFDDDYEKVFTRIDELTERQLKKIEELKAAQKGFSYGNRIGGIGNIDDSKVEELREEIKGVKEDISSLKGRVDTLEDTTAFDTLSSKIDGFDEKIKNVDGTVENLTNSFKLLSELSLTDLQKVVIPFFNGINQVFQENNGKNISGYWNKIKEEVDGGNVELKEFLSMVGLIDSKLNSVNVVSSGLVKSGGLIGDSNTLLATKNKNGRLEETKLLKDKLDEAYEAGINVSRILDIIGTKDSNVFLEIQETASGKMIGDPYGENPWINPDVYKATDEQIKKLISDIIKLNKIGIGVDINDTNIFFDDKKGFSFIDLDLSPAKYNNNQEIIDDMLGGIVGGIEDYYSDIDDKLGSEIVQKFRERFEILSKEVQQAYAEAQDSHSPSKEFEKLENDAVEGIIEGANKNEDRLKNVGQEMAENIKDGFKDGISEISNISSTDLSDLKPIMKTINDNASFGELTYGFDGYHDKVKEITSSIDDQANSIDNLRKMYDDLHAAFDALPKQKTEQPEYYVYDYTKAKDYVDFKYDGEDQIVGNHDPDSWLKEYKERLASIREAIQLTYKKIREMQTAVEKHGGHLGDEIYDERDIENAKQGLMGLFEMYAVNDGDLDSLDVKMTKPFKAMIDTVKEAMVINTARKEQYEAETNEIIENNREQIESYEKLYQATREAFEAAKGKDKKYNYRSPNLPWVSTHFDEYFAYEEDSTFDSICYELGIEIPKSAEKTEQVIKETSSALQLFEQSSGQLSFVEQIDKTNELIEEESGQMSMFENVAEKATDSAIEGQMTFNDILDKNIEGQITLNDLIANQENKSNDTPITSEDGIKKDNSLEMRLKEIGVIEYELNSILESINDSTKSFYISANDYSDDYLKRFTSIVEVLREFGYEVKNIKENTDAFDVRGNIFKIGSNEDKKEINETAKAYEDLISNLKKYFDLKSKYINNTLSSKDKIVLQGLNSEILEAVNGLGKYEDATKEATKAREKFNKALSNNSEAYGEDIVSNFDSTYKIRESDSGNKISLYSEKLSIVKEQIEDLRKKLPLNFTDDNEVDEFKKLNVEIEKTLNELSGKEYIAADSKDIDKFRRSIYNTLNKHSAMPNDLKNQLRELDAEVDRLTKSSEGLSKVKLDELKKQFTNLGLQIEKTGKTGISMMDKIKKKFKDLFAYFATYVSLQDFIQVVRQGFETIKEYDVQLTEMNKVSDESISKLKEFQKESFDLADSIGTTASQIQSSTADFMRLGESLEQAKQSAQDANILYNVSEFESIDAATESLVSMSQAFKELEKGEIIDVVNNLGNNFAISTDGLATALQNSASALKTAKNDFFESAALTTAANTVVQDPDKVGAGKFMPEHIVICGYFIY